MDIWLAGAAQIDMLTPDIYQPNFAAWCQKYTQRGNPLFIPEMRRGRGWRAQCLLRDRAARCDRHLAVRGRFAR